MKKLAILLLLCTCGTLWAQQVYPVRVNASLVQPNSLVLSEYTFNRADDIMFVMTLTDPVEPTRLVRFRITVLNDGNPVLVTDPNYAPPPIVLESQIPQMFNGADLAGYLNPTNLQSLGGNGQPGDLLPSGYNSICIEVIDVARGVPISDRICANGFFELAQPPLINSPACGSVLPWTSPLNRTFSWTPMHLLSPNRPSNVSYEFTLVKLFPGVADPNDGFNLSTVILQKTVQQPTVQYIEGQDPPLEQDGLYAWRVRAIDGRGYNLFMNNGYSLVCTFAFENGGQLGEPLFACEGGQCAYSEPISSNAFSGSLSLNDQLDVGFFKLTLTAVSPNSQGGYSGTGTVYIPYLFSKIKVNFSNIRVNADRRVFDGDVYADETNTNLIPSLFSAFNTTTLGNAAAGMATGFADGTAQALTDYFNNPGVSGPPNMVSLLKNTAEQNAIPIGLPIGLDQQVPGTPLRTTVAVTGIRFTPRQANLNAVLATQLSANGTWVKFGVKGLCFQPRGLALAAPTLALLTDVSITDAGVPLTFKGLGPDGEMGTFASWNCEGFEEFVLKGQYDFNRDYVRPVADPEGQVSGVFTVSTRRFDDILLKVDGPEDFYVTGASDFPFHVGDIWLDFSTQRNPDGLVFPDNFPADNASNNFKGAYITAADVTLPPIFQQSAGGTVPKLRSQNVLFNTNGMTGQIIAENLINLSTGDLGGWGYSMDSAWLNITANSFVNSGFKGKMRLPIMRDEEALQYEGFFQPDTASVSSGKMDFGFRVAPDVVTIDLLRARIEFDDDSEITVGRTNGVFDTPKANLSGLLTAAAAQGDPGFVGQVMAQIQALQEAATELGLGALVPQLNIDGIRFEGMKIDLSAQDKFKIEQIVPQNAQFQFLGVTADLSNVNFSQLSTADLTQMNMSALSNLAPRGFRLKMDIAKDILGALSPSVQFTLVIKEEQIAGKTRYGFGGFDIQFEAPEVSFGCNTNIPPIVIDPSPSNFPNAPVQGNLKVGQFILKPAYPLINDNGTGLISGTGTVDVDILGPFKTLSVTFNNVQVDQTGRVISGDVITGGDAGLFNSPNLSGVLANVQSQVDAMVSGMNQFSLPVVLGKKANGENERDQGLIIMGLVFGPQKATARAKVVFDTGGGDLIEFVADGLTLVPNGVANFDLAVGLARDFEFQPINELNPLVFKAYDAAANTGSFIRMDCKGFLEFNLQASYTFSQDVIESVDDPETPVTATFTVNSLEWGEFLADMQGMGRFTFPGMTGFEMTVSDAYIDFSRERNVVSMQFPENYDDGGVPNEPHRWRGFYMPTLSITLPPEFAMSSAGAPTLTCQHLLMDNQGVSFSLFGNNLIDGNVAGWGFALDSVGITVVTNELINGGLAGSIVMPLMDNAMPYVGHFEKDFEGYWSLRLQPLETAHFSISALHAYMDIQPSSEIVLASAPHPTIANRRIFKPYANLYGKIGIDVSRDDFASTGDNVLMDAIEILENLLGIEFAFEPPAISFYGLKINHPELPAGRRFGLDAYEIEGGISIGGHDISLDAMDLYDQVIAINNINYDGLGLQFTMGAGPLSCTLGIWAKKDQLTGKYGFGKFVFEVNAPQMSCVADPNNPAGFTVGPTVNRIQVPFLASTFEVEPESGSPNYITTLGNSSGSFSFPFSLVEALASLGSALPFDLVLPTVQGAGGSEESPFDFIINGITFKPNGTATMNADLKIVIDGEEIDFRAALPIDRRGIYFNNIKIGLAKDLH